MAGVRYNIIELSNKDLVVYYGTECAYEAERATQNLPVSNNKVIAAMEQELITRLNRSDDLICMTPEEYDVLRAQQRQLEERLTEIIRTLKAVEQSMGISRG